MRVFYSNYSIQLRKLIAQREKPFQYNRKYIVSTYGVLGGRELLFDESFLKKKQERKLILFKNHRDRTLKWLGHGIDPSVGLWDGRWQQTYRVSSPFVYGNSRVLRTT